MCNLSLEQFGNDHSLIMILSIESSIVKIWQMNTLGHKGEYGRTSSDERLKSQKNPPEKQGEKGSGNIEVVLLRVENNVPEVLDEGIDVLAEEAKIDDEGECTAKAVSMLEIGVRAGIHHEVF